jgi:Tol biopolymer transport system component
LSRFVVFAVWVFGVGVVGAGWASAPAAFPGRNGAIVISSNRSSQASGEVYSIRPDGAGRVDLSQDSAAETDAVWSPDGSHIAFSRAGVIVVMDADGSGQLTPGAGTQPAWSPDGSRLAFVRGGAVWVSAADGAGAVQLSTGSKDASPTWSPDSTRIAFTRSPNYLEVVPAGGGSTSELARGVNLGDEPVVWAADGRSLFYGNAYVLYRVAADGSTDTVVLRAPGQVGDLALAPGGRRLAFAVWTYAPDKGNGVWTVDLAIGSTSQLTKSGQQRDGLLAWSPGGDRIAYVRTTDVRLHIITVATDTDHALPREHPGTEFDSLRWSPDGSLLLFSSAYTDDTELYTFSFVGNEAGPLRQLTDNWFEDIDPAWSPDGKEIAFASNRCGNYDIYVMRADGSGVKRLTRNPADDVEPGWSPDGKRIVFASDRPANAVEVKQRKAGVFVQDLYVIGADGSGLHRLTGAPSRGDSMPSWSPDGKLIAFSTSSDPPQIETMWANGTHRHFTGQTGDAPDWSPNGKTLVFQHEYYPDGSDWALSSPPQVELALMTPSGVFLRSLGNHGPARWSPDGTLLAAADGVILNSIGDVVATVPAGEPSWQPLPRRG